MSAIKEKDAGNEKEYELLINDNKYQKQIARIERQAKRHNHESNLYYDEVSITEAGIHKIVTDNSLQIKTYEKELVDLFDAIESNGEGFFEVEDCLFLLGIKVIGGRKKYLSEKLIEQNPKSHKMIINCFSKDINESPMAKPVLSFNISENFKFKMLNSNFFVLQVFMPEIFCKKYSDDATKFHYHEIGNDFFISIQNAGSSLFSGIGAGTYHRLFNYLQRPETIFKTSKLGFGEFQKLSLHAEESLEEIAKKFRVNRK